MAPPSRTATILVVEDDRALREFYRTALTFAGYEVVAVEDGLDALRWLDQYTPDAVVLDLALPRVGGHDVQRDLRSRADTRHIPVVIVTGGDARDINHDAVACVLRKPVTEDALVETVEKCLRGSRPERL